MQDLPHRRATYADLLAAPPNVVAELIAGELFTQPRPRNRQANTYSVLGGILNPRFQLGTGGPGGWWILVEPGIELPRAPEVSPDVAGWRRERMPTLPTEAISVVPDWVCEVLSPSTARFDRTDMLSIYASFSVGHCWYVDPLARTMEVFELTSGKWLLAATFKDADSVAAPPFAVHTFSLDALWPYDAA